MNPGFIGLSRFKKLTAPLLGSFPDLPGLSSLPSLPELKAPETPKDTFSKLLVDGDGNLIRRRGDSERLGRLVDHAEVGAGPDQLKVLHHEVAADGEDHGYAILSAKGSPTDVLTVALGDVTGIEDSDLYKPDAENYFADAWNKARTETAKGLGYENPDQLPRDLIALAVNSQNERSQDRLHIHADVLDPKLRDKLREQMGRGEFGSEHWTNVEAENGHQYRARWIEGDDLEKNNPFKVVRDQVIAEHGGGAAGVAYADAHMGQHSILVVGHTDANGKKGFLIIEGRHGSDPGLPNGPHDSGSAEEWLIGRGERPA